MESAEIASAFRVLSSTRSGTGYGPNPISLSDIKAYIDLTGSPWCDNVIFIELIYRLDRLYLKKSVDKPKGATGGGRKT